jgi:multiple sugar transport system substrate-binding protein/putative aldouronate transport system substrate-binding protein
MANIKGILKKLFVIGLTGAMLLSTATACGGGGDSTGGGGSIAEDWSEGEIDEIELFCNDWEQFNNAKAVKSPIYRQLVKAAGCDIKAISTSLETYYTQIDLQRSTGKLRDMFIIDGPVDPEMFYSLIRDEEILPISDYVTAEKYPNLYNYLLQYDYMKQNVTYADGKLWWIPVKWQNEKSLYVRRDWINNLNAKLATILVKEGVIASASEATPELLEKHKFVAPDTLDQFYRLARAFTLYDPDNNGKNDTYGYVTETNRDMDSWLHVAYGGAWKMWIDENNDGTYENTNTSKPAMLATSFLNKMISEGYVSREVVQKSVNNKQDDFSNGNAGMMYAHNWYNVISANMMASNPGLTIAGAREKILIMNPSAGKDGDFGGQGDIEYYRGWVLRNGMSVERRTACLDLMEFLHSPEGIELVTYGVYGEHWEWKDDVVGGEKITLVDADANGFVQALRWTDYAAFASYLTETPYEAEALLTNGDILVERARASAACMVLSDYPDLYTETMTEYAGMAADFFDTEVLKMMINSNLKASWTYDEKTWAEDGMTKVYTVSSAMQQAWDSYVQTYNTTYRGAKMQEEYNALIKSGSVTKRTK